MCAPRTKRQFRGTMKENGLYKEEDTRRGRANGKCTNRRARATRGRGDRGENRTTEYEYARFFEGGSLKAGYILGVSLLSPQIRLHGNVHYEKRKK